MGISSHSGPPMEAIFSEIYYSRAWGGEESVSGPGSGVQRTASFRSNLSMLLEELHAEVLLDAGCGDFNWMKETELAGCRYIGVDVVPDLIRKNAQEFEMPRRTFLNLDLTEHDLPQADVVLCRDCLVHFSFEHIFKAIRNFKRSKSRYLLTTTFIDWPDNIDIATGGWRQINLQIPPFGFPEAIALIDEKCEHSGGVFADKRLGLWDLTSI
jgi:SAM-dependent methyltransferase